MRNENRIFIAGLTAMLLIVFFAQPILAGEKETVGMASFEITNSDWLGLPFTIGGGYEFQESSKPNLVATFMLDVEHSFDLINFAIFGNIQQSGNVQRLIDWNLGPGIYYSWYFLKKVGQPQKSTCLRPSFWVPVFPQVKGGHFGVSLVVDFK